MKTNQILVRPMGEFKVSQRTSDGMFNATELLKQWNEHSGQNKEIKKFFENSSTKEFIEALISEEDLKGEKSAYLKSRGKYSGGTWMHPLLFIDFAMWLNPVFKVKVLKFAYDQLLSYRNEAGNTYRNMCNQIAKITDRPNLTSVIQATARAINHIVYGDHERNIRNLQAEESLMAELVSMQKKVTMYIEDGVIKDSKGIIKLLKINWRRKYEPKILQ